MSDGKPYKLPSPVAVCEMLARAAWDNDISDQHRLICEMGSDTVRILRTQLLRERHEKEVLEAKLEEASK